MTLTVFGLRVNVSVQRPTLGAFRNSRGASSVGLCGDDIPRVAAIVNEAQERLINDPLAPDEGWWGNSARMAFNVSRSQPVITTPRGVARLILLDVCKQPVRIRNEFYEFLEFGAGFQPGICGCGQQLQTYERETVVTLSPLLGTATIRVFPSDTSDLGKTVLLQGNDQNGKPVISTDSATGQTFIGERIVLSIPFSDSVNQFSTLTTVQKDITNFPVTFAQVDPTTFVQSPLSIMEPSETDGYYRTYFINGLPANCCPINSTDGTVQVLAQARLEFIPVMVDADYLMIQNIPALIQECMCIRDEGFDDNVAVQRASSRHAKALQLLNGQLDLHLGKTSTAVSVPIFGSQRLRASFV